MTDRYLIAMEGRHEQRVRRALALALAIAGVEGSGIILVTHYLDNLSGTILQLILMPHELQALIKRETISLLGVPLRIESRRTLRGGAAGEVVVAPWPDGRLLADLDGLANCGAVIVVP